MCWHRGGIIVTAYSQARGVVSIRLVATPIRKATDVREARSAHSIADHGKARVGLMNIIIWLLVGGLIGWLASVIMRTDAQVM